MKPKELVSRIIRRVEPPAPPPEPSRFKKEGGWASERPSAGGFVEHLSPEECAAAQRAGAEALIQLQKQQDVRPRGPIYDQHIS